MLTKRTNVLLTEEDYTMISILAKNSGKTMGELIRHALKKTYKKRRGLTANEKAFKEIAKITKGLDFSGIDYKELINYGRKY